MIKWARFRLPLIIVIFIMLVLALLAADRLCYEQALAVEIDTHDGVGTLHVDGQTISLGSIGIPTTFSFAPHDPVIHEYQLDGIDTTNDGDYLHSMASSAYYRFQAWMRDLDGTSRWRDLQVRADGQLRGEIDWPANGSQVALPPSASLNIRVRLQRPEIPMTLKLTAKNRTTFSITFDRGNRQITVFQERSRRSPSKLLTNPFFPLDPTPFAAMVADFLVRTVLWSILLLVLVLFGDTTFFLIRAVRHRFAQPGVPKRATMQTEMNGTGHNVHPHRRYPFHIFHPIIFVALGGSLLFVSWIALVLYHAGPHVSDANAYFFAAKMYAIGRFSIPTPLAPDRFPQGFIIDYNGQWFTQYPPGTGLTLVPGIWLGVPWLIEPLLGTFTLLGIGLIAARLYDRHVAMLAIVLGVLSPFYSYLAASYLSHAVVLFYLVWGWWALLRFAQGEKGWNMLLSAASFGMAGLTRELDTILFVILVLPGVVLLTKRCQYKNGSRWIIPGIVFAATIIPFIGITLLLNQALTSNALITPRTLNLPYDHWGFGKDVGFYGQHTLAAGFVNMDQLLTTLSFDLFGWPFYFTLAFIPIPFLTGRAKSADWFILALLCIMAGSYIGYYYHGIYLGPRYFFENLPTLLILTARGIFTLGSCGVAIGQMICQWFGTRIKVMKSLAPFDISITTGILVTALILCNLLYFMPQQITAYQNLAILPYNHTDLSLIYHPPVHHAIIVTNDYSIYESVLFGLNDPLLHGDVIYAYAQTIPDYTELQAAFPGRQLYHLVIDPNGLTLQPT